MTSMQLNSTLQKMTIDASHTSFGKKKGSPAPSADTLLPAATPGGGDAARPAANMWMSVDPAATAAAVWANRSKPLFSKGLMDALREKGAVMSFVDVQTATPEEPPPPQEPAPQCSLEDEMQLLRSRLKEAREEIRISTVEALGYKRDLKEVRHKGHKRLTRKSSLETLNNNGGRWTNRPAAVTNIAGRHASTSSTGSDSYDEYGYSDDDGSCSDAELERRFEEQLEHYTATCGERRGSGTGSVLSLPGSQDSVNAWATSTRGIAGRRRRRQLAESSTKAARNIGAFLHLRQMSSGNASEDAAGEHIFDGSAAACNGFDGFDGDESYDRASKLGQMRTSLLSVSIGGGSAADLFATQSERDSPLSRIAGHGGMPSSPKHRRRKKKGGGRGASKRHGGGGGSISAGNSPKPQRRKQKRTNADGSPRKRGGKKGPGVKASRSVPTSALARASFSTSAPKLPSAHSVSHSAPSSPRVSRRGADRAPSPSQIADAIAAKKSGLKKSNLMLQSPMHSPKGSLLALAPKLSALMYSQSGLAQHDSATISG